jgi:choline dehydrogenase
MRYFCFEQPSLLLAGAIGSPQLLQLSGVGDPAHLAQVGVAPLVELPQAGLEKTGFLFFLKTSCRIPIRHFFSQS